MKNEKKPDKGSYTNWQTLKELLQREVINYDHLSSIVPGILHINNRNDLSFEYMSKNGCDIIGYSIDQLKKQGSSILEKHQSVFTREITHPRVFQELNNEDPDKVIVYYQDWKRTEQTPFFFLTTTRILNESHFLSISFFPAEIKNLTQSVNQLFGINKIFLKYYKAYNELTNREKQILYFLGKEYTRFEISSQLFIAESTVKKHCENIFRKLGTHKRTELEKIAIAFVSMDK